MYIALKHSKGDELKVVNNISRHNFRIGTTVTVLSIGGEMYRCSGSSKFDYYLYEKDVELINASNNG